MILEAIFEWFLSILTFAIDLLPDNGSMFNSVKGLSYSIFGFMTLLDGYLPIREFIVVSGIVMLISLSMNGIRVTFGVFQMVMRVKP